MSTESQLSRTDSGVGVDELRGDPGDLVQQVVDVVVLRVECRRKWWQRPSGGKDRTSQGFNCVPVTVADLIKSPGFDNPREPERWNPRLTLVREILLTREPEVAKFPSALRLFTRLAACSTAWSRQGTTVLHYRF